MQRAIRLTMAWLACCVSPVLAGDKTASVAEPTFEKDVRPIFKANCFQCHGEGDELKGKLDLRLQRLIVAGGESGAALVPGNAAESLLIEKIQSGEMPPGKKKLTAAEIAVIERWAAAGAKTARPEPAEVAAAGEITADDREFWSFQPIRKPDVPRVKQVDRVRTPIDAFLLAKLEEKSLSFSPDAERESLLRRACFDLTGLPPSPEEADRFLSDTAPDAWERLIARLLDSPHYGERWGRHWLDIAGYADSDGYTDDDPVRKYAFKYRDYVIRGFNADKPFDQFIQEQLAGDEMVAPPYKNLDAESIEKLVATGFLRTAPDGTASGAVNQNLARNQVVAETLKVVSTALLGLSVGCAQCHNHRYDPIPQSDYYRLRAIFEPAYDWKNWRVPAARSISLYTDADRAKAAEIEKDAAKIDQERLRKQQEFIDRTFEKELAKLDDELREAIRFARDTPPDTRTPEQKKLLKEHPSVNVTAGSLYLYDAKAANELKADAAKAAEVRATKPVEDYVAALTEVPGQMPVTHLFFRGDHEQPKQSLAPGELTILASATATKIPEDDPSLPTTGRRLAFARRLTDGTHPLTARVLVNRVWMHHFGRGIAGTDFGFLGERPTHPELLDWLATEFMESGWHLKALHKLIMTSTVYRQASRRDPSREAVDPDNHVYSRMPVRRLEAEVVRDSILAASGRLNRRMFGPPVPVMEDEVGQFVVGVENKNGENRPGEVIPLHGEEYRRSLYVQVRRSRPLAVLDTFDAPVMEPNCEARTASTVAPQSLLLMNNEFVVTQAGDFARRVFQTAGDDPRAQAALAWRLAFTRAASVEELDRAVAFLAAQTEHFRTAAPPADAAAPSGKGSSKSKEPSDKTDPSLQALATFCQALLSANGLLYVD